MLARTPPDGRQHALHVIDYCAWKALADLRAMGVCGRKADRLLTNDEHDFNQESMRNGDGPIY
jgi:hypothetical protein